MNDITLAFRQLWKKPGFALIVVLTLALGIGANTAIFSVVYAVLLNPLPYPKPDQIVTLHQKKPNFETGAIPYPNFRDWQTQNQTFASMAIHRGFGFILTGAGEAERVNGQWVSADFFRVLGVQAALGRTFASREDEPGAEPVVLLSSRLWQRKFGSGQSILGRAVVLDDKSYTIIGVLPPNFNLQRGIDVYAPIGQWNNPALRFRGAALGIHGIGRLKPNVTLDQAQADMDRVSQHLAAQYPDTNKDNSAKLIPLKERLVGNIRPMLLMLLAAVAFVLLIACANVGNLLMARGTSRAREFAIRVALGAGRWRVFRQLLSESIILSLIGGGCGFLLAGWGTRAAIGLLPIPFARANEIQLNSQVLIFTVALSLLTGVLAGLAPAFNCFQQGLSEKLKAGANQAGSVRYRAQGAFVATEIALALVLLVGAGLMIRSLSALWNVNPGFNPNRVLSFGLSLPALIKAENPERIRASLRQLSDDLNSLPGVHAASFSWGASPLQGEDDLSFWIEGQPKPANSGEVNMAIVYRVEPSYLKAMGIPLKRGRFFTNQDTEKSTRVAVIDEIFAQKYFPNTDPLGKLLNYQGTQATIVGVVGHVKQWGLDADDTASLKAQLYESFRQLDNDDMPSAAGGVDVLVRAEPSVKESASGFFESIRHLVLSHNNQNVAFSPQSMNQVISGTLAERRFSMILLDIFAIVALLLSSIGIYGVLAYAVTQRTREIGVRIALGATRSTILRLALRGGMLLSGVGILVGLLAAFGLTRFLANMLYEVKPTDPLTFVGVSLLLWLVSLLASWLPARRAAQVEPMVALRTE